MHFTAPHGVAQLPAPQLEDTLAHVEGRLAALCSALRSRDTVAIDLHAGELHRALAHAVDEFSIAARSGPVPSSLRTRLASASGQVVAERESLARATAALDRAIDVLLPREHGTVYSSHGGADRSIRSGVIRA